MSQNEPYLKRHPEFEMDTDESWLPEAFRGRMQNGSIQLMGHIDQTEGFFIARLKRKANRR